jgi:hypothetical protein
MISRVISREGPMASAPLLVRFTEDERKEIRSSVKRGTPGISETAFVRGAALLFAVAVKDPEGSQLLAKLATVIVGKRGEVVRDAVRIFGNPA